MKYNKILKTENMKKVFFPFVLFICINTLVIAQQQESYTFCTGGSSAYLLDTAATTTSSAYKTFSIGQTSYVAHFQKDTIYQGYGSNSGAGGYASIKKWAWNGSSVTCVWTYTVSNAHHDICPMPNGNVLIFVRETKTKAQVTAIGGVTTANSIYFDIIREIHPTGTTTGTVVWEWKLWDHLCQSTNSTYPNYFASVSSAPQLWNINCNLTSDGFHPNGIDYNPIRDQIVFSSHNQDELFVIDHSTTTAQAATHAGGNAGKGGDFLYRRGKPQNYGCTANGNGVTLNVIHDARWVPATNSVWPDYISFFHNNTNQGNAQAVLHLPTYSVTDPYNYTYTPGSIIGPTTCIKPTVKGFTVQNMGGCQALDNGNILITNPITAFYECRNSSTALQSVSVSTVQSDRLKKSDVFGPYITASSSSGPVCTNNTFTLNCNVTTAPVITNPTYTYSWTSVPAGFTSSLQNPVITPTTAGTYIYTVVVSMSGTYSSNTITTTTSASVTVVINSTTAPTITSDGTTLTSSSALVYQWYLNGTIISTATSQFYSPTQSGLYSVLTIDANGCAATSVPYDFIYTGINESVANESIKIYPNPSTGLIYVNGLSEEMSEFEIFVYDLCGKVLYQSKNEKNLDLSELQNGIYYLTIISGNNKVNKKISLIK